MIALLSRKKNKRLPVSKVSSVPFKYRSFRNGKSVLIYYFVTKKFCNIINSRTTCQVPPDTSGKGQNYIYIILCPNISNRLRRSNYLRGINRLFEDLK